MLRRVALVRTDFSEETSASFIRVTRIGELGTTLLATSSASIASHRRENLKSYDFKYVLKNVLSELLNVL
jgi:hypothetical protein